MKLMIMVILVVLGLCLGSFINALVWRLYQQSLKPNPSQAKKRYSILSGRSMCPDCQHRLGVWDLIPVISWISLGGKCRYCQKPISWQYPLIELLTAALFVISYLYWPLGSTTQGRFLFVSWLVLLVGLIALAVYDYRWMLLPNKIIYPLIGFSGAVVLINGLLFEKSWAVIGGAILGALVCGGLFYLLFQVSGGRWIGGGDVKLGLLVGIIVGGPLRAVLVIFLASIIGSIVGLGLMLTRSLKSNNRIPFGPFLILATVVVYLFGVTLVEWYKMTLLVT